MKTSKKRSEYVTRDTVMKLLSDDETARVATVESGPRLSHGDEYVDLEHLDLGVLRADGVGLRMGNTLARNAVQEDTWTKIVACLAGTTITASAQ